MKKRLLICSALALAGCSSSPGTSDVKKFLEPKFASCENIEIVDIKKTNGYEEDGYYRVEFTYGIELKDPSMLKQLLHTHEQEKESVRTWLEATEARKKHISFLQREIDRIYDEYEALGPQRHQFSNDGSPYPSPDRLKEYFAAFKEWKQQNPPPSSWQERKDELAKLYADGPTVHQPNLKVYKNEFSAVGNYYNAGCPRESFSKFILEILKIPGQTVQETQDVTNWFQEYEIKMQGTVTMRKTDNGWRALSEG